jgi:integrase
VIDRKALSGLGFRVSGVSFSKELCSLLSAHFVNLLLPWEPDTMPTIAFSDRKLKSLSTPPRAANGDVVRVDYWDESLSGFGLRISSSGTRTWMLMTRVLAQGKQKQIRYTIGEFKLEKDDIGLTLAEARVKATETLRLTKNDIDPRRIDQEARQKKVEASLNTFGTVADDFLLRYCAKHLRPNTIDQYKMTLARKEFASWRDRPITDITRKDVHRVLDTISDRAPIAANRTLAILRKLMNWAVERGHIPYAPTTGVKAPEQERTRKRHLFGEVDTGRPSELALAWRAFKGTGIYEPYFKLLLLTGQRRMEVAAISWNELQDLDGENPRWVIPAERAKNGVEHIVPLGPMAVQVIKAVPQIKDCPFLFSVTGKTPISGFSKVKDCVDRNIEKLKAEDMMGRYAGQFAEPWVVHDLRRSQFTGLVELGFSADIADALQNHVSGSARHGVRKNYNIARYGPAKRAAMLAWETHITSCLSGKTASNVLQMMA